MKKLSLLVVVCCLLFNPPLFSQQDDCDDYCDGADLDCQSYWYSIHQNHHYDGCQNYDQNHTMEGYCEIGWVFGSLNLGYTRVDCFGGLCTIVGEIKCGNSRKPYSLECTTSRDAGGDGEVPRATGSRTGAMCHGDDASFGVACNSSTGQLVYSIFGN